MAKIVAFSSNKGGVLKTSLSINVAGTLTSAGKKTLIIDMDNQGNVATSFGKDADDVDTTIYDLLTAQDLTDELIKDAVVPVAHNLDMIVANDDMAYFEIDVLTDEKAHADYFTLLKRVTERLNDRYDFIVIDTPPAMGLIAANIFNAAQDIVIPYQPEQYAFRSLVKTVAAIKKFEASNKELKVVDIVPTKVRNTNLHSSFIMAAKNWAKAAEVPFSDIEIRDTVKYGEMTARLSAPLTMMDDLTKTLSPYKDTFTKLVRELGYIN